MKKTPTTLTIPTLLAALTIGISALAGFTACESTPPAKVSSGSIHANTFSFVTARKDTEPGFIDNREGIHSAVQAAITQNLTSKGLSRVATGGDVTVAYMVIVGNNVSTISIRDYFGYNDDSIALQDLAQKAHSGSKNPNHFEAGTLLIDIVDGKSFKLLKRGYATRPILRDLPADARAARVQSVVDEILKNLALSR